MPRTIYFVRHGETHWNVERRMQGQWEADLTTRGLQQAEQNAETLAKLGVDAIFASPLRRARDSAQALSRQTRLAVTFDDRLKEWNAGDWSGNLYDAVQEKWPAEWAAWRMDMWGYRPPGAENFEDLANRGGAFLEDILETDFEDIAVVSHGFIGRAMMLKLARLAPSEALRLHTANDVFFRFQRHGDDWKTDRFEAGQGPFPGLFEDEELVAITKDAP